MSPLGRLLDWLSWKYKVLFIVSIGNCDSDIAIEALESQWEGLTDDELVRRCSPHCGPTNTNADRSRPPRP